MTTKHCFVIGPIGERDSEVRAHADDLIKYIIAPVIDKLGYGVLHRSDTMPDPGRITGQIIRQLKEADLVIADLTGGNPNVYYELSLRHALRLPLVHMALDKTRLPFDVTDSRTIFFHMHSRRAEEAREELRKQIHHIQTEGFKASNPIVDTIEMLSLEGSSDPLARLVGQMMSKVDSLSANVDRLSANVATRTDNSVRDLINTATALQMVRDSSSGGLNSLSPSVGAGTLGGLGGLGGFTGLWSVPAGPLSANTSGALTAGTAPKPDRSSRP